jgi:hypothetical protein
MAAKCRRQARFLSWKSTLIRIAGAIDTSIVRIRPRGGVSQ